MTYTQWREAYQRRCDRWRASPEFERASIACAPDVVIVHNDSPYQDDLPWFEQETTND